jgi:hypothetical protein
MQQLYDVDEYDTSKGIVAKGTHDVLEPNSESGITHCTERSASFESTEESTNKDNKTDALESGSSMVKGIVAEQEGTDDFEQSVSTTEENKTIQSSGRKPVRKVTWGNVAMRMFPVIPGDHPDTREGPPVSFIL